MQIENSFAVKAPPDRVYEFLLDVNNVVSCVPGAELSEVVDPNTFKGKVRIKVGPVTVSYNGTARITSRDAETRSATLEAEGRETTGSIRLHEKLGFTHIGVLPSVGFKFGRWVDIIMMQRELGPGSDTLPDKAVSAIGPTA